MFTVWLKRIGVYNRVCHSYFRQVQHQKVNYKGIGCVRYRLKGAKCRPSAQSSQSGPCQDSTNPTVSWKIRYILISVIEDFSTQIMRDQIAFIGCDIIDGGPVGFCKHSLEDGGEQGTGRAERDCPRIASNTASRFSLQRACSD